MPQETEGRVESKIKKVKKNEERKNVHKEGRKKDACRSENKKENNGKRDEVGTEIFKDRPRILPIPVTSRNLIHSLFNPIHYSKQLEN